MNSCAARGSLVFVATLPLVRRPGMNSCAARSCLVFAVAAHPLLLGEDAQPFGISLVVLWVFQLHPCDDKGAAPQQAQISR